MNRPASPAPTRAALPDALPWVLRTGVALCFIGHGAFGIITKQAWLPYLAVGGIPESLGWRLMPWIGAMDIVMGFLAFVWPCRALFVWAACWTVWTALLRPFAGQGWPEFFERAGNYGVPLAILVVIGLRGAWFARLPERWPEVSAATRQRLVWTLRLAAVTLVAGHAACALVLRKPALAHHYAALGLTDPAAAMLTVGWFELALAAVLLVVRAPALLVFVSLWKLATEALFLTSGAATPFFEIVERGGSYVVPLALACLLASSSAPAPRSVPQPA